MRLAHLRVSLLTSSLLATAALAAQPLAAQTAAPVPTPASTVDADAATAPADDATSAPADAATDANEQSIVVTGSRIARPELQSISPVAVVSSEQLQGQGITNVQDLLQKLPQAGIPGYSRTNTNFGTTGNGISSINLRNLGSNRTLVLVNGRRFVAGVAGTSIVDVNNIPADLIERVETLTGGASATYGSDAVAGVVNFVLKDNIDGIIARTQYGVSERGDNQNYLASISGGQKFGPDGRGSIIANFTYARDLGLYSRNRTISAQDCLYTCGPEAYSSYPAQGRFQLYNGSAPSGAQGGFGTDVFTFDPNNNVVSGFPVGSGFNRNSVRRIAVPLERYLGTAAAHYDVTDGITAYVEGTYAKTKSSSSIEPFALDSINDLGRVGYALDNPYIPASVAAQIAARNSDGIASNDVTSIQIRRRQNEIYSRSNTNSRDTWRIAGGFRGDITDKWNFDLSGVYGVLKDHTETADINTVRYAEALDAIRDPATGQIVCRSATARAAGCAPLNLFGYNTASPEASAYVRSEIPRSDDVKNTELVVTGSVTGTLFTLPGGDVKTSVGAEYRREKSVDNWDALTNAGLNSGNQTPDTIGKFDVKEVFGELNVPLLADRPFVESLSLSGQARYSDYSTVGSVFSWNAGGEWSPIRGLRFRGNYAVANRAPNIGELYSAASETFPSVQDPCNGVTATSGGGSFASACRAIPAVAAAIANGGSFQYSQADLQGINGFDGGNRNLKEETGKTITAGAVLTPSFLPGFSLTADYFNIKVSNAIGNIDRGTAIEQCLATGLGQFCDNVIRDPSTGLIRTVNAQLINIANFRTSGLDFNARYGRKLGLLPDDRLDLALFYTHTISYKNQSDPSAPVRSGVGNIRYGEVFRDKLTAITTYSTGPFSINWTATYLSKMVADPNTFDNPTVDADNYEFLIDNGLTDAQATAAVGHNHIKARIYNDVQLRARVGSGRRLEVYLGANNLFDVKPPVLEDGVYPYGNITGTTTAADVYDVYGRRFYAGVQVAF